MVRGHRVYAALALLGGVFASTACESDAKPRAEAATTTAGAPGASPRGVELAPVTLATFEQVIETTGTLAADEQVTLATKVAGRVASIAVDLASPVKRGDLVAQIETADYELGVQQAEAALGQARAQLGLPVSGPKPTLDVESTAIVRQARATLEEARAAAARFEVLAEEGLSPQAELDTARASLLRAEAVLQAAREEVRIREAQVRQRESELRIARQQLADTTVRSPLDGVVQARQASAGEFLAAGAPIAQIVRIDPLRLRLALPEREASSVQQGQTVHLSSSAAEAAEGDPGHSGVVARVAPSLDAQSRSLLVEADIPNTGQLRPGNFVRARIVVGSRSVPTVPESAIVTFAGLQKVITVKDGRAVERPVTTGLTQAERVEIISGLEPGEAVVKSPGSLQQGQAVSVLGEPG